MFAPTSRRLIRRCKDETYHFHIIVEYLPPVQKDAVDPTAAARKGTSLFLGFENNMTSLKYKVDIRVPLVSTGECRKVETMFS